MKSFLTYLVALLFMATGSLYAQLSDFTITATTTPQTCLGNGSVNFTVNGNNQAATLAFAVYLLPNTTTPYTTVTALSAPNLVAGQYLIIATQSLNGQSNTAQATATVADNTVLLTYALAVTNISCNANGSITVNVTSGTATQYEIISGPVTVAPQASNVFSGLPAGQYSVRVHDTCGDAFVTTVQLVEQPGGVQVYVDTFYLEFTSCNTVQVRQFIVPQGPVAYPLTFQYTVYPPGGGTPIVTTAVVNAVGPQNQVYAELPFYHGEAYFYNIKVTDSCGTVVNANNNYIYRAVDFVVSVDFEECDPVLLTAVPNEVFTYPITVSFAQAPAGFNPSQYNPNFPVFTDPDQEMVFSNGGQPMLPGLYTIVLTDACGRTAQIPKNVSLNDVEPDIVPGSGCTTGMVIIGLFQKEAEVLNIISAPEAFTTPLPANMLGFETDDPGVYEITGLPPGDYTVYIKDSCGFEFTETFTIVTEPVVVSADNMPGCDEGFGSVRLTPSDAFTEVIITGAPEGFNQELPFDASLYINSDGVLSLGGLPEGEYTYTYTTRYCEEVNAGQVQVTGYHDETNLDVIANCGSFDLFLEHASTVIFSAQIYWLQRYDEVGGTWGHPETGLPYSAGIPNMLNSVPLTNNFLNINFPYTGQFRIVKVFYTYQNGGNAFATCVLPIKEFTFTGAPEIIAIYGFPCDNGLAEVVVEAVGKDPLTYLITTKANEDFIIDNGQSNIFTGLEGAVYNFRVVDDCNNMINVLFDVSVLAPLEVQSDIECTGVAGSMWLPQFQFLEYEWYRASDPDTILSTTNTLGFSPFTLADAGTYMVHIVSVMPGSCIDMLLEYKLDGIITPKAGDDSTASFCGAVPEVNLETYLSGEYHDDGTWQDVNNTGMLNGSIVNTAGLDPGDYVFSYTVTRCDATDTASVTLVILGENTFPVVLEKGCVNDRFIISITNMDEIGQAELIEWYGPDGFSQVGGTSIDITGLPGGDYYAVVTNADGCTATAQALPVAKTRCDIPKGISPNGDPLNNNFDLGHLDVVHLIIFNRYGLQVYEANEYVNQWHGQSDAGELCTGVYYYVVTLREGSERTGWVYLQTDEN